MQSPRAKHQGSITGHDCRDAGGRAPKVGALGDAGAVAEDSPVRRRRRRRPQGEDQGWSESQIRRGRSCTSVCFTAPVRPCTMSVFRMSVANPKGEGRDSPSNPCLSARYKSAPKGAFLLFDKDAGQMQYPRAKHKDLNPLMQPSQNRPTCEMEPNTL
jgi:hypothetical protein